MAVYFVDSSALVKRYVSESGSAKVLGIFDPALQNEVFVASITGVEIIAAISRRSRMGSITPTDATLLCSEFRNDFQVDYQIVEITDKIVGAGMNLAEKYKLRGYDAIQLAVSCAINSLCSGNGLSLTFVSADNELNAAASGEGIVVMNPNIL